MYLKNYKNCTQKNNFLPKNSDKASCKLTEKTVSKNCLSNLQLHSRTIEIKQQDRLLQILLSFRITICGLCILHRHIVKPFTMKHCKTLHTLTCSKTFYIDT